jgi:hypothetical protein
MTFFNGFKKNKYFNFIHKTGNTQQAVKLLTDLMIKSFLLFFVK